MNKLLLLSLVVIGLAVVSAQFGNRGAGGRSAAANEGRAGGRKQSRMSVRGQRNNGNRTRMSGRNSRRARLRGGNNVGGEGFRNTKNFIDFRSDGKLSQSDKTQMLVNDIHYLDAISSTSLQGGDQAEAGSRVQGNSDIAFEGFDGAAIDAEEYVADNEAVGIDAADNTQFQAEGGSFFDGNIFENLGFGRKR